VTFTSPAKPSSEKQTNRKNPGELEKKPKQTPHKKDSTLSQLFKHKDHNRHSNLFYAVSHSVVATKNVATDEHPSATQ